MSAPKLKHNSIGQILHQQAERFSEREAIVSDALRLTYRELLETTGEYARMFIAAGIRKGVHVGVLADDAPETLMCFYALWRIGAVVVPICTAFGIRELRHCVRSADIGFMVIGHEFRGNVFPNLCMSLDSPSVERIYTLNRETGYPFRYFFDLPEAEYSELEAAEALVTENDPDAILFSSGSTGNARPVLTTHFARVNTIFAQAAGLEADEYDRFCSVLPLFHCFAITGTALAALAAGACLCFPAGRSTELILRMIERERCTVLNAVPTLFSALLRRQKEMQADLSSLRTGLIGGSSYPPEFFRRVCGELGYTLVPSLGQTEATGGITCGSVNDSLELRSESLGRAFPLVDVSLRSRGGSPVPPGVTGEVWFRGFNGMAGYYNMPAETAKVIDGEGWIHTGDLAKADPQGNLYYRGRIKDLIIRGGENISPEEIENLLLTDGRISRVKIVDVPDPHYMEEACACVVLNEGAAMDGEDVQSIIREHLSPYKVPRYVLFFDRLPLNATGKIDRRRLRAYAKERLGMKEFK
ncbi:MAG: AMP-binding protein [Oscillospiraceae bacterium]|nr:AMP-binding protein [Oscillospiraceae bacterium]